MLHQPTDFYALLRPETHLEAMLLETPAFQEGLDWGTPRFGHPEGKVGLHIREVLDNVEKYAADATARQQLRLITFAHDTFKFEEFRFGRRVKHHGLLAREFMEKYVSNDTLLDIIELHDEAFYIWRAFYLENQPARAQQRLENLMERIDENLPLYFHFYKCDTQTGDKIQAPLRWFRQIVPQFLR
ncbi:MAG: hypothetical protein HY842_10210 [Bacteroidetes bacterium]|nr:hypothetical protein [Bacteroidota bacterium]